MAEDWSRGKRNPARELMCWLKVSQESAGSRGKLYSESEKVDEESWYLGQVGEEKRSEKGGRAWYIYTAGNPHRLSWINYERLPALAV